MANEYKDLTEKQKRFIDYYIQTANATKAAEMAGYSKKTAKQIGNENLTKLDFFIQEKLKEKQEERIASQDEVLQFLTETMRANYVERQHRVKCAELLGKRYGTFAEKIELNQEKPFEVNINIRKK